MEASEDGHAHHFTDATASASDQHDFTVDTEEILNVKGGHGCGSQKRFGCWDQHPTQDGKALAESGMDRTR